MSADLSELAFLHDAALLRICLDLSSDGVHTLTLTVRCHPNAGHDRWNGQTLQMRFEDVVVMRGTLWGYGAQGDTVDALYPEVSDATVQELDELRTMGVRIPSFTSTLILHSGSKVELVWESMSIRADAD